MKSHFFIGLACSILTLAAQASEQNDTTLLVRNPDCVTVEEGNGQMKVTVEGMPGNATFRVERCRELKDNGITVVRERTNWGIDLTKTSTVICPNSSLDSPRWSMLTTVYIRHSAVPWKSGLPPYRFQGQCWQKISASHPDSALPGAIIA